MDTASILENIEASLVSAADYRIARRLLDGVSNQWTVYLTRSQACQLCGTETWAGARRALNRLMDAGIIQLHTNNCAYVTFLDRAETGTQRAEQARERAETAHQRAEPARDDLTEPRPNGTPARRTGANRAETAHQRAERARPPLGSGSGRKVGRKDLTYLPTLDGGVGETTAPEPTDQARSAALLTDDEVGVVDTLAVQLAQMYPFEEIRRQVFQYRRDCVAGGASAPKGPGVIPGRLKRRHAAKIIEDDLDTPLWARHMTEDESAAWGEAERRRAYIPAEYSDIILG